MNYADSASKHFGRNVLIAGAIFSITALAEKMGKLKDGSEAPYLTVTAEDGKTDLLHPRTAVSLFSKGEAAGVKMLVDAVADATPLAPVVAVVEKKARAKAKVAPVAVPETKKAAALAIFNEVVAAHGTRAEVIKRIMTETGSSLNLANTYYQNMRGGRWE